MVFPAASLEPIVTKIAGKFMGTLASLGSLGSSCCSSLLVVLLSWLTGVLFSRLLTLLLAHAARQANTALGGRSVGDPDAIIEDAGRGGSVGWLREARACNMYG